MAVLTRIDRTLPVPPEAVWPYVTDPVLMSRWSLAPVRGIDPGDGGGFGAVGALRRVDILGPLPALAEVIEHADPPGRLVYRVVGTRWVRFHRGELRLDAVRGGTRLRWNVDAVLPIHAFEPLLRRLIEPRLQASLDRLVELFRSGAGSAQASVEPAHSFADDENTAELRERATAVAAELDELATAMRARGDARHWFTRVYQFVTEAVRDATDRGEITNVAWALRLILGFHDYFMRSVEGPAEAHWREAFATMETIQTASGRSAVVFRRAIVAGARAHIERDLPRVLAHVYRTHYAGRCDYVRFRADFLLLASPIQQAWKRMSAAVPDAWFPPYVRAVERILPPEATEYLLAKRFIDPLELRRAAFDRGRELAEGTTAGIGLA